MNDRLPPALVIISVLFILGGFFAAVDILAAAARGNLKINFGMLGIVIGIGLLLRRPEWRICALVFTWLGIILTPILFLLVMTSTGINFTVPGQPARTASKLAAILMLLPAFALLVWQCWVLTRSSTRELFQS